MSFYSENTNLEDISLNIFNEDAEEFTFEIKNDTTVTSQEIDEFTGKINEIKNQLDIILQNTQKENVSPQADCIKSLFSIELDSFLHKIQEYNVNLNQAINIQQNIEMISDKQIIGKPVLISVPLG